MSVFRFSDRVPKTAWRSLPTFITPAAPSALSRAGAGFRDVVELDAQARDAGVEALDVAAAAEGQHELTREVIRPGHRFGRRGRLFALAARRHQDRVVR